ncbi:MAG: tagaturonate reductase [Lachnospiraceae bacterium]|nr:tagaturonate reductase [Lachnospiraceae bacterium]
MKTLSYETLKAQNYDGYLLESAPERVFQFGEGNFLRGFTDYFIDVMNEKAHFNGKVVVCQPIASGLTEQINKQEGLYTLFSQGFQQGEQITKKRVISCISRCLNPYENYEAVLNCADNPDLRFIICNTTEAGIVYDPNCRFTDMPASSFPGKLTQFLYRRFQTYHATKGKGFIILACELIDNNGKELEQCVLKYARQWELGADFISWLTAENVFCSTLVDRIVTGYPHKEAEKLWQTLGYKDHLINTGELFALWVIEGPDWIKKEFPVEEAKLPILITDDHKPYKTRKVRVLNGAHTAFVPAAYLAGQNIVRDCMNDKVIHAFMNKTLYEEILPTLDLPKEELLVFAAAVTERFQNPFIDHALLAICLNTTSKWKTRLMPSLKEYIHRKGQLPACITASFAFYIAFYSGKNPRAKDYEVQDAQFVLDFFHANKEQTEAQLTKAVCQNQEFWGEDLSLIPGFEQAVLDYFTIINQSGAYALMRLFYEQKA